MKPTLIILLLLCCGCTTLWTKDVFYNSFLTNKDIDIADINTPDWQIKFGKYQSKPAEIKAITPYGVVEVGNE